MIVPFYGIGSDMDTQTGVHTVTDELSPPWGDGLGIVYYSTARQILQELADGLWSAGYRTVFIPTLICESVIAPFTRQPWTVEVFPSEFFSDSDELTRKITTPATSVLISLHYFGIAPLSEYKKIVSELQAAGVFVIEDETHRIFNVEAKTIGNVGIASLRKLLPVADGAYARGETTFIAAPSIQAESNSRWEAMDEKSQKLLVPDSIASAFAVANCELESEIKSGISFRSFRTLRRLDYGFLGNKRRENFFFLLNKLTEHGLGSAVVFGVSEKSNDVPAFLVLRVGDAPLLQKYLADHKIYCPIHWPAPEHPGYKKVQPPNILSIPIDHRYGIEEMAYVAEALEGIL